jgi:L,D-transpeptidase-like protein
MTTMSRKLILLIGAILLAVVPIVAGVALTSGTVAPQRAAYKPAPTPTPTPAKSSTQLPPGPGALIALVRHPSTMRSSPGGASLGRLQTHTQFGSPQMLWVVSRSGPWLGVISPQAGNGRLGWIPVSAVRLSRNTWEINVSLAARRVEVLEGGRVLQRYTVAIGRPSAPTPSGRFAVTDRLLTGDPTGPYGCCILALSAHSPHAIQGWNGGTRIAIHSTPDTGSIGLPVSHGCLRLTLAEGHWLLGHVPLGTPTLISSA